ncbi:uncharacterized protein LOC9641211 [Selaginella moellendorffii]|uniref:uncharacterized protein LOC9641211 n=1 Tax=Selaginella moellendorffii TaxID=88036 RepID=UPI000D1C5484|nr:uncharacterized protein LOC9641211 [Selaginella moellendorffii]|eukprot:XP_024523868.1 uncharacterized protein LOC9641211 [Selaginella moellendorffii]
MTKALSDEHKDRAYQVVFSEVASGMLLGCGAVYVVAVSMLLFVFLEVLPRSRTRPLSSHIRKALARAARELPEATVPYEFSQRSGWGLRDPGAHELYRVVEGARLERHHLGWQPSNTFSCERHTWWPKKPEKSTVW